MTGNVIIEPAPDLDALAIDTRAGLTEPTLAMRARTYRPDFRFSDLVAGYVVSHDSERRLVDLRTSDGRPIRASYTESTSVELLRNLGSAPVQPEGALSDLLGTGRFVFVYGIFSPEREGYAFQATRVTCVGDGIGRYAFEAPDWWPSQLAEIARFYRRAQFGESDAPDFEEYRTHLGLGGEKNGPSRLQETDTISRLVYGMASAYLLTGEEGFLDVAERGTEYLRNRLRFVDQDNDVVYWYHGLDAGGDREVKLFASEFDDDAGAIPAYEQIYALAGPTQTYRLTGDPRIKEDIDATLRLFDRFFRDTAGGYYSHVDPVTLDPHAEALAHNRSRKNWNSIGDHAPAYLINLYLATGQRCHADRLEECFDLIVRHFPDQASPFVRERFHQDWTADRTWRWQQDRAVVGHNLKIAWNLLRMNAIRPKESYRRLAAAIGLSMPGVGSDRQRGGWYDVMERVLTDGAGAHRLPWHDRKAWWQQEQAILAYLILAGNFEDEQFLRLARESAAYYNAFFLDHDAGGVYFNVLADGMPYLLGTERLKGSHSMSAYHSTELCLLATVYQRLLIQREPLDLWFRPLPNGFRDRVLRVAPDALPAGRVRLDQVRIDGSTYTAFDPAAMAVALPDAGESLTVQVRLSPVD